MNNICHQLNLCLKKLVLLAMIAKELKCVNLLTVELIRIRPPAGIVRTTQANSDLSSRRAGSEAFPTVSVFACPVETSDSGKAATVALFAALSPRLTERTEGSDADGLAAELACSAVETWPSGPFEVRTCCSCAVQVQ